MELAGVVLALVALAILAVRYGYDSRIDEHRFLSKEQELAAYGVTWSHPAQPPPQPPRRASRVKALVRQEYKLRWS